MSEKDFHPPRTQALLKFLSEEALILVCLVVVCLVHLKGRNNLLVKPYHRQERLHQPNLNFSCNKMTNNKTYIKETLNNSHLNVELDSLIQGFTITL